MTPPSQEQLQITSGGSHEDGSSNSAHRARRGSALLARVLAVATLSAFALAQPLFDVVEEGPPLFIAHGASALDIVAFAAIISLVVPALYTPLLVVAHAVAERLGSWLHLVVVFGLVVALVLPILGHQMGLTGWLAVGVAVVVGLLLTVVYARRNWLEDLLAFLSPAVLVFALLFLVNSPVGKLVVNRGKPPVAYFAGAAAVPVVLVVFDELPTSSLMNADREIDSVLFPNLRSLGERGTWYRQATTVHSETLAVLPAMLDGRYQTDRERLPIASEYPNNLFAYLSHSYDMNVHESVTDLCAVDGCTSSKGASLEPVTRLLRDSAVLYLHIVLPEPWRFRLPSVELGFGSWADGVWAVGRATGYADEDAVTSFHRFVDGIRAEDPATLHFFHRADFPHAPWVRLPDGRRYTATDNFSGLMPDGVWGSDERLIAQDLQRHLLQVSLADTLVGELVRALEERGLWESALVIVTADHGVSFFPGTHRRTPEPQSIEALARVPLFVKLPFQETGGVSDADAAVIDISPTIAHALGEKIPWTVDGRVLDPDGSSGEHSASFAGVDIHQRAGARDDGEVPGDPLAYKVRHIGRINELADLFVLAGDEGLTGQRISALEVGEPARGVSASLMQPSLFDDVALDADFIPILVSGRIEVDRHIEAPPELAIAVNDAIGAVTGVGELEHGKGAFLALVAPGALREGRNTIEIFAVERRGQETRLHAVAMETATLDTSSVLGVNPETGREYIASADSSEIELAPDVLLGYVTSPRDLGASCLIYGWAVDPKGPTPVDRVAAFVGTQLVASGATTMQSRDVMEYYDLEAPLYAGFQLEIPAAEMSGCDDLAAVRVFAVKGDTATEIAKAGD